ncbi:multidrug ABC transporter permease [Streptococcus sp. zg-86]|uniref:Multidrug ABC transporter permease n=1 Tax=Streptococcus zhangguiae TaxID=2664091 RepID=A0A6I4RS70_9STRE|nr:MULTISPECIES: ABC transporter permease [unclassified Streptococcus]MTB63651.1 multidrug ABC transporter permease [Streptococcus sp. zg-86]MTB89961.1 multidrug ABC transporter permease [Streptococcus sp. zg-36]MWV55632.1 multidrug ABC transporter permease [Streptococcus sp. zg-70]QTH48075.1 ABC transporter permease [Streptococcus sp. zg-86]
MTELFQERRRAFIERCLKYLRYVLNDHFVLVLMVLLGFLALQYRELLEHFPANPWGVSILLVLVTALLFFAGRIATYIEPADRQFLLPKEMAIDQQIKTARLRAIILWGSIQVVGQGLLFPLYLKLGWTVPIFVIYLCLLSVGKSVWVTFTTGFATAQGGLDWDRAIQYEIKRKQNILQFYSLFTHVKGISSDVKRRQYLDFVLNLVKKRQDSTWAYLFLRGFLRSGDFFWLSVRLLALTLASLCLIQESWLATGLTVLFDYLLLFQLLALYHVYDYQYVSRLYPISAQAKRMSFQRVIRGLMYGLLALQLGVGFMVLREKIYLVVIVGMGLVLTHVYLGVKSKKLID